MIEVEATHITTRRNPAALVCEVFPGVYVVDGGGVHTVREGGNAFAPLPEGQDDRTFPVNETQMTFAEMYDTNLREADEFEEEIRERRRRR